MKTIRHKLAILLFMLPCLTLAGNGIKGKYTKEKKIAKAYIVNDNCALNVTNQFGTIYVTTWDENKTQIEVVIKVSGNNEEKVEKRLASIDVNIEATKAVVDARTKIGSMSGNNLSMEINYTIKIPKKGSINLTNQYGGIITGKIYGKARINSQYGDVNIDELNSDGNSINLQYSDAAKINYMKSGDVTAQYSSFNLTKGNVLKIKGQYTDIKINEIQDLTYNTQYGGINVKKSGKASGTGDYSDIRFGYINGIFNATCNYGNIVVDNLDKSVKNVAINTTYSNIIVHYPDDYAYDFEFYIEYGSLTGASSLKFTEKREKDNTNYYKGYYKNSGVNRVFIKSEYGDINLGRN